MRRLAIGYVLALSAPAWATDEGEGAASNAPIAPMAPGPASYARTGEGAAPPVSLVLQHPFDRAQASLVAEARAMADLVAVLKREVREGRLDLSTEGKLAWQAGVRDFDAVQVRGQVGDWRAAMLGAMAARTSVVRGADEAFSVRVAEPVKLALKSYLDAVEPRVEATRQLVRLAGRDDLDKRWLEARELFQEAKTLASVDRFHKAWGALVVSAGKLDQLVLQSVYGWRPEETEPEE